VLSIIPRPQVKRMKIYDFAGDGAGWYSRALKSAAQVALATLCLAAMWLFVDRVVVGHQVNEAARTGSPRGNLSDLYPVWVGSREVLLNRRNPYGPEVAREIQTGYYGRVLDPSRANDPTNQQAFAYPVYVAFLLAPTVWLPFSVVRVIFFWMLLALTAASVLLWLKFLRWKLGGPQIATTLLLVFASFQVVQGLKLQQLSLLVAFLIAAAFMALLQRQFLGAGVLIGLAMIKPQLAAPVTVWLMLWTVAEWRRRWRFAAGFVGCMIALVVGAEFLLPGWIGKFAGAVSAYRKYAAGERLLEQMLPAPVALPLLVCLLSAVAFACWHARKLDAGDEDFALISALVLAVTLLISPMYPPHYQLLLLPGVFMLARNARPNKIVFRFLYVLSAGLMVWSWLLAIVLAGASFFTVRAQQFWAAPLWTTVLFPVPVISCLGWMAFERGPVCGEKGSVSDIGR
jgi:hypothetical protein